MNRIEYLTPMDGHLLGRLDAKANLVTPNLDDDNCNVVVDNDALVLFPGQNQHP